MDNSYFEGNKKLELIYMGLYHETKKIKPKKIVDLGTGCGSCAIAMARALQELDNGGKIYSFDLDKMTGGSQMREGTALSEVNKKFSDRELESFITVKGGDVFKTWVQNPTDFDLLYIDLDNTWDKIYNVVMGNDFITSKIRGGTPVFIEGGHPMHPRMNEQTLRNFNNENFNSEDGIFTFDLLYGDRISLSKLTLL